MAPSTKLGALVSAPEKAPALSSAAARAIVRSLSEEPPVLSKVTEPLVIASERVYPTSATLTKLLEAGVTDENTGACPIADHPTPRKRQAKRGRICRLYTLNRPWV